MRLIQEPLHNTAVRCFFSDERSLAGIVVAHNRHLAQSQVPGEGVVCPARGAGGGGGTGGRPMIRGEAQSVSGERRRVCPASGELRVSREVLVAGTGERPMIRGEENCGNGERRAELFTRIDFNCRVDVL